MLLPTRAKPTALVCGGLQQRRGAASVYRPRGVTALGRDNVPAASLGAERPTPHCLVAMGL